MDDPSTTPIITFYSYKGGVGRTMALANVAWLLAEKYGKNVLLIDWDLEAPGLHRFLGIEREAVASGLIDIFYDYKKEMSKDRDDVPEDIVRLKRYLTDVPEQPSGAGSLSYLAAGHFGRDYKSRVNGFDWNDLYDRWHGYGFVESLKAQFRQLADVVLIDSRTGVTDTGGICTRQLPDVLVLLYSMNEQNISGIEDIASTIALAYSGPESGTGTRPRMLTIPSRVEVGLEQDQRTIWEARAAKRLGSFNDYTARSDDPVAFVTDNLIPYVGYYGFGEHLAVRVHPRRELAKALSKLTDSLIALSGLAGVSTEVSATDEALMQRARRWWRQSAVGEFTRQVDVIRRPWLYLCVAAALVSTLALWHARINTVRAKITVDSLSAEIVDLTSLYVSGSLLSRTLALRADSLQLVARSLSTQADSLGTDFDAERAARNALEQALAASQRARDNSMAAQAVLRDSLDRLQPAFTNQVLASEALHDSLSAARDSVRAMLPLRVRVDALETENERLFVSARSWQDSLRIERNAVDSLASELASARRSASFATERIALLESENSELLARLEPRRIQLHLAVDSLIVADGGHDGQGEWAFTFISESDEISFDPSFVKSDDVVYPRWLVPLSGFTGERLPLTIVGNDVNKPASVQGTTDIVWTSDQRPWEERFLVITVHNRHLPSAYFLFFSTLRESDPPASR
jgi:hypothetical protein